jgi:hypothetical protein
MTKIDIIRKQNQLLGNRFARMIRHTYKTRQMPRGWLSEHAPSFERSLPIDGYESLHNYLVRCCDVPAELVAHALDKEITPKENRKL